MKCFKASNNTLKNILDYNGHVCNIELVRNTKADLKRVVGYVIKDGNFKADNVNVDAIMNEKHERKYNTKQILETPMDQLIENDAISPRDVRSVMWAQQWYKLHQKLGDKEHVRGIWLVGPAGCGKSTAAREIGEKLGGYYLKDQNKWWDGYDGEPVVILDDLDSGALCHHLKIWADKFAFKGEVKGGTVWLSYDWFIVTTNHELPEIVRMSTRRDDDAYPQVLEDAIKRRFHIIRPVKEYLTADEIMELLDIKPAVRTGNNPDGLVLPEQIKDMTPGCEARERLLKEHGLTDEDLAPPTKKTPPNTPKVLPMEPDLDAPTPVQNNSLECMCGSGYGTFNGDLGDLPQLASEPEQEPEDAARDSLSEFCDTTSIDWEALHAAARDDPSYTMSGGCEEGASYSTSGEAEPSSGEDL
nr:MAG: rep protein [Cressdnaviricota sp.]